jgi:hypothetical protein
MKRLREFYVSSTGAAVLSMAMAAMPNGACTPSTGGGDAGGSVERDAGSGSEDANAPEDATAQLDASTVDVSSVDASSPDGVTPTSRSNVVCLSQWPEPDPDVVTVTFLATDASGNSYLVVDYDATHISPDDAGALVGFNLGEPPSRVPSGFAVAKFDNGCNLVWVREFGPKTSASTGAMAFAAATDDQGNLTVTATFVGTVDFGAGAVTAGSGTTDGVLLRLAPSGDTVFATPFVNPRSGTTLGGAGLAVTPGGVSTIALQANTDTDFGNGPEVSLLPGPEFDVVQFDGTGKVVFRKPLSSIDPSVAAITGLATNASGFLWAAANGPTFFTATLEKPQPFLLGMTASGAFAWDQSVTVAPWLAAGPAGAVLYVSSGPPAGETLQGLAADGSSTWTTTTLLSDPGGGPMLVDRQGEPVVLGTFQGSTTFGTVPTLTAVSGAASLNFQVFDPTGHLTSVGAWGTIGNEAASSFAVDASGNIVVAASTIVSEDDSNGSLSFAKLAR